MWNSVLLFCVVFVTMGTSLGDDLETIDELVGESVFIPCADYVSNYKFIVLEVSKDDNTGETERLLTVDFRKKVRKEFPSPGYLGRAVIGETAEGKPQFKVMNITIEDEGIYHCTIIPHKGINRIRSTRVQVIIPPKAIKVLDERGREVVKKTGPYNEGKNVTLICQVMGGRPPPKIKWYEDKRSLRSTQQSNRDSVISTSTVVIGPLARNNTLYRYRCEATNYAKRRLSVELIELDINLSPNHVEIITDEFPMIADKSYNIECMAKGGKPPALITWDLSGVKLQSTDNYTMEDGTTSLSTITFTPKDTDGGKSLRCSAKSPIIAHEPLTAVRNLTIHFPPKARLSFKPSNIINEGAPLRMTCESESNPPAVSMTFYKNREPYKTNVSELVIPSANRTSVGLYSCVAMNFVRDNKKKEARHGQSNAILLQVRYRPICQKNVTIVGAGRDETVNITCGLHAWPEVRQHAWSFNASGVIRNLRQKTGTISYQPKTEAGFGDLLCTGRNEMGELKTPCIYRVIKAEFPDRLENCTQINRTSTTIRAGCVEGRDGGLPQRFIGELVDITQVVHVQNVTENKAEFFFDDLSPGTMYFVKLYSRNDKGNSEQVILSVNTSTLPDPSGIVMPSLTEFPITSILAVLIGIVAALVFVAVLITVVMRIRETPAKGSQPPLPLQNNPKTKDPEQPASDAHGIPKKLKNANLYEASTSGRSDAKNERKENSGDPEDPEVHYAELTFKDQKPTKSKKKSPKKKPKSSNGKLPKDDNTLYATIDYSKTDSKDPKPPPKSHKDKSGNKPTGKVPDKSPKSKTKNDAPQPPKSLADQLQPLHRPPSVIQASNRPFADQTNPEQSSRKSAAPSPKSGPPLTKTGQSPPNEAKSRQAPMGKPQIPPKPRLIEDTKRRKTVETQTSDEEDGDLAENSPLMRQTLESNL